MGALDFVPGLSLISGALSSKKPPVDEASPAVQDAYAGIDPETMLKAEQAFDNKYSQIGGTQAPVDAQVPDAPPSAGQLPPDANVGPQVPEAPQPDLTGAPVPDSIPPAGSPAPVDASAAPVPPGTNDLAPVPAATSPGTPQPSSNPGELGPVPQPPALTGDPARDSQNNTQFQRDLTQWSVQAQQHGNALAQKQAEVESKKAGRELELEQNAAALRNDESKRYNDERAQRQSAVDQHIKERADAYGDLSKGNGFLDQSLGDKVVGAIIFALGARQQAFSNVAAAQLGQVGHAENEGLKFIDGLMARRYQQKKDRLAAASDGLLEARYGFKDASENHRAALNDLDADAAANYRLAAKETGVQAAQLGSEQARDAGNKMVAELLQKGAQHEEAIHQREEELGVKRDTARANQEIAKSRFDQGERQIKATEEHNKGTLSLGWASERDRHNDRQDALAEKARADAERAAAKKAAADEKEDATAVRGDNGEIIGHVPTGRGGAQGFATRDADYKRAEDQLAALKADIDAHGEHVIAPEAVRRRQTLMKNAKIGVGTVSPLGKTNEAMQAEGESIGDQGILGGAIVGANTTAIERKIKEVKDQREQYRKQTLIPVHGTAPTGNSAAQKPDVDALTAKAWRAVNAPNAPRAVKDEAMKYLVDTGQL